MELFCIYFNNLLCILIFLSRFIFIVSDLDHITNETPFGTMRSVLIKVHRKIEDIVVIFHKILLLEVFLFFLKKKIKYV